MSDFKTELLNHIRAVPDFPLPGILFRDISPIFLNPDLVAASIKELAKPWQGGGIDKVIGIDSRGFLLGPQLAGELGAGFVMVRKKGKLPPETVKVSYTLEYGSAELESVVDVIQPGDRVLIHDDLLATGGTASASASLVEKLGGIVVGFSFIITLNGLPGKDRLEQRSAQIHSLVAFD